MPSAERFRRLLTGLRRRTGAWLARRLAWFQAKRLVGAIPVAAPPTVPEADYRRYLTVQIAKSRLQTQTSGPALPRTRHLVALLSRFLPPVANPGEPEIQPEIQPEILCVGCRDTRELDEIEKQTGRRAIGVDLFSDHPRIVVGDFHNLPFESRRFEALYSCHSLEHAYDLQKALAEFSRVLQPGGLWAIEVPIAFTPGETDRQDVGSVERLIGLLEADLEKVLWQEDAVRPDGKRRDARLIARKKTLGKPADLPEPT